MRTTCLIEGGLPARRLGGSTPSDSAQGEAPTYEKGTFQEAFTLGGLLRQGLTGLKSLRSRGS